MEIGGGWVRNLETNPKDCLMGATFDLKRKYVPIHIIHL